MCNCGCLFVYTEYSQICTECGTETECLKLDTYSNNSAPLVRPYERHNRFASKLDKLLGWSHPTESSEVWKIFKNKKPANPSDVRKILRESKIKMKHYDCVRVFTDAFTKFRCQPYDALQTRNHLIRRFAIVYSEWSKSFHEKFFSYDWLMRVFLEEINSPLLVYLKPKTSKRRGKRYKKMLNDLKLMIEC